MEFVAEYGLFLLKTVTIAGAIILLLGAVASMGMRHKPRSEGELVIKRLNDDIDEYKEVIEEAVLGKHELKALHKQRDKEEKAEEKAERKRLKSGVEEEPAQKRVYVIDFNGDVRASEVDLLRHEITAILTSARAEDEIVLRLESPGGMVHTYGLAASQLERIRNQGVKLTICVDEVAASGGYMMACLADRIIAAPFALVGSIGVMAQLPNFNKLLTKHDVDYELFTAGEYKRTVTMFGQNTDKARDKFQSDLEETHVLFKQHIQRYRPKLDVAAVANGDVWYGQQAVELDLIDELGTSDDYITKACADADVFSVRYEYKKTLQEKIGFAVQGGISKAVTTVLNRVQQQSVSKS
ncbi:protease SohB [Oceanobacter sp. 3_MG-2023]|uniref:protease SohB n=1 Tax=Oceanobacter sp. 3_MG-2023 TaxID=3062622 RepID=UPI002736AE40|nr:protease SohB [Oceanobacter sp. 3_MG-2023]MDP2504317.1 protease SohB [Oceanobacter sp. 3_MG-2023]